MGDSHGDAGSPGALGIIASGWQLSGIFESATGTPFSVLMPCAAINAQGNNCRPNRLLSGDLPAGQRSVNLWFNPAAFRDSESGSLWQCGPKHPARAREYEHRSGAFQIVSMG